MQHSDLLSALKSTFSNGIELNYWLYDDPSEASMIRSNLAERLHAELARALDLGLVHTFEVHVDVRAHLYIVTGYVTYALRDNPNETLMYVLESNYKPISKGWYHLGYSYSHKDSAVHLG